MMPVCIKCKKAGASCYGVAPNPKTHRTSYKGSREDRVARIDAGLESPPKHYICFSCAKEARESTQA